jgi:hypothetical protein
VLGIGDICGYEIQSELLSNLTHRDDSFHSVCIHGGGDLPLTLKRAVAQAVWRWCWLPPVIVALFQ